MPRSRSGTRVARRARRGGPGSHQQLLQLLLDAGQGGSPVEEGAELVALRRACAPLGTGLMLAFPRALVLWGDTGQGIPHPLLPLWGCVPVPSASRRSAAPPSLTLVGRWKPARCTGASGCCGVELSCTWGGSTGGRWGSPGPGPHPRGWALPCPGAPSGGSRGRRSRPGAGR